MYLRPVGLHPDKTIQLFEMIEILVIGHGALVIHYLLLVICYY